MKAWILAIVAAAALATAALGQSSIRLLRTARVPPGRPVLLRDVATVRGPQQDLLGEIVVSESPGAEPVGDFGWFEVPVRRVESLLEAALGPKAGMVALSGSACSVRVLRQPAPSRPEEATESPPAPDATPLVGLPTVRGAVARELCRILDAAPAALRLRFDAEDASFLDRSIQASVLEISPAGSSARMPVTVTVHDPSGRMERRTIRVAVELRRLIAVASRAVERGNAIEPGDICAEERWLPPGAPTVSPEEAAGALARRRIAPGEPLEPQAIEPPLAIERGDRVWVRVVTRGLVVRREAHAIEDGREGDEIEFAAIDDSRQRFRAVVTGRGEAAVMSVTAPGTGLAISAGGE